MSKVLAPFLFIEERTLSIGLGVKRSSQGKIGLPQLHGFAKSFLGGEAIPFRPLLTGDFFRCRPFHIAYPNAKKISSN